MADLKLRLLAYGYTELFQRLDEQALDELWAEPGAPDALERLALDDSADPLARFLAAEVVFSKRPEAFGDEETPTVSMLYATALRRQLTGSANEWSLPGQSAGRAGEHLLALGAAAAAALLPLLQDDTPVFYEGSRDAMAAKAYRYRVKDLAAQFIAAMAGARFPLSEDPAQRDAAIAEIRSQFP